MQTKIYFSFALLFLYSGMYAQQSGNAVYGQNSGQVSGKSETINKLYLNDSAFIIQACVAMNVIADTYIAVFAVAEESPSLMDCNATIDKRIQSFISEIEKLGISKSDIYIDMTTQNKIYDYHIKDELAEQYLKGFELKKNVIVKFNNISDLEKMVISASKHGIYDLVKVDYLVSDVSIIYKKMFQSAVDIINSKKELYVLATNSKLDPVSQVYAEEFNSYSPPQLYKSYKAYESSNTYQDYDLYRKTDLRKSASYYYDRINYSGFDKIINPVVTEPAVEYVLTLQIRFMIN